jgi:uncharacterized protein (TIGR00269 family)
MKCKRCRCKAEVQLRHHNSAFCRGCFLLFFERQVQRAIERERMFVAQEPVLVAVSGGKDSLALWDVLVRLGYDTAGLHLALGIGDYSRSSMEKTEAFARARGLRLITVRLEDDDVGVPTVARFTNRSPCAACGTTKRHYFDRIAFERGFGVLATGHNLDDEAARLLGNVLHWQLPHLAKQRPVLEPTHERFARKVKPLCRVMELETAAYAFFRGIDYVIEECPNSAGATQLAYKDAMNRLEAAMPGTKSMFVQEFARSAQTALSAHAPSGTPGTCERCGMPAFGTVCSFCRLVGEVDAKRAGRRQAARA